jgi:hypothetical protein
MELKMNRYILIVCVLAILGCTLTGTNLAQSGTGKAASLNFKDNCTFPFRFIVLQNSRYNSAIRHIEVFLDDSAFTERNLSELFTYLSKSNPEPMNLTVIVYTDWKQLPFYSDCPPIGVTNQPADPDEYNYHRARFWRRQINGVNQEFFEFNPVVRTADVKTISLPVSH